LLLEGLRLKLELFDIDFADFWWRPVLKDCLGYICLLLATLCSRLWVLSCFVGCFGVLNWSELCSLIVSDSLNGDLGGEDSCLMETLSKLDSLIALLDWKFMDLLFKQLLDDELLSDFIGSFTI